MYNVLVLCYHELTFEYLPTFETHLQLFTELGYKTISAQDLFRIIQAKDKIEPNFILLTFDDGHVSNWLLTAPLLQKYNFTGVFFVITDFIVQGKKRTLQEFKHIPSLGHAFELALLKRDYLGFMNYAELKALQEDYGMEVYAHSSCHAPCFISLEKKGVFSSSSHWGVNAIYSPRQKGWPVFPIGSAYAYNGYWPVDQKQKQQGDVEIDNVVFRKRTKKERYNFCIDDFKRSYAKIRTMNKSELQFFCWPWGHFDKLSLRALQEIGFKAAFTLERGYNGPGSDSFRIKRLGIGKQKSLNWLKNKLWLYKTKWGAKIGFKHFRKKED